MRLRSLSLCLLLALLVAWSADAANDLLWVDGTDVRFGDATQVPTPDVQITLGSSAGAAGLPAGQGRISNVRDWGATQRPARFRYQCQFGVLAGTEAGKEIELYAARSYDGTLMDGISGLIDAALTGAEDRYNLMPIGLVRIDTGSANGAVVGSGLTPDIPWRYWSLVVWNATAQAVSLLANRPSYCIFTPMYLRVVP